MQSTYSFFAGKQEIIIHVMSCFSMHVTNFSLMKLIEIQNRVGDFSFLSIKYIFSEFENNKILIE